MSFLNPVNEPVLRFKSTDTGAPQINHNARVAGDVKAVLKACLVTGYGDKASAGWSIANEVNHVAEFVSPSAAMSDYRLGIGDTSASSTTWYYQYQDVLTNCGEVEKSSVGVSPTAANGWYLLVTAQGVALIEKLFITSLNNYVARFTYWGRVKSALVSNPSGINISWLCVGHYTPGVNYPAYFFTQNSSRDKNSHHRLSDKNLLDFAAPNLGTLSYLGYLNEEPAVLMSSPLYLTSGKMLVAVQPGFYVQSRHDSSNVVGVEVTEYGGRPVIHAQLGANNNSEAYYMYGAHCAVIVHLDYWEY